VASLPCAFWTVNCEDDRPAAVSAWVRYGASNWTYRAEVTVSGRITATLPLPAEASGFRADIAEKVRSNWSTEIDTLAPDEELALLELPPLGGLEDEELPQAAAARHKASDANAAAAPFLAIEII
jgi:hypothetical protein